MNAPRTTLWDNRQAAPFAIRPAGRLGLLAVGTVLLGLLGTAAALRPEGRGYGTHQQLGLPPCTFKTFVGMRCPSCGMTTAWAHLMRGQLTKSAAANVGGLLLGVAALSIGPWALVSGLRGRWLGGRPSDSLAVALTAGVVTVTLIDWAVRIFLTG